MFGRIVLVVAVAVAAIALVRTSSGAGRDRVYVVRPADTLWAIAARTYAGDTRAAIWKIAQRNGLHGSTIRPGQKLYLP